MTVIISYPVSNSVKWIIIVSKFEIFHSFRGLLFPKQLKNIKSSKNCFHWIKINWLQTSFHRIFLQSIKIYCCASPPVSIIGNSLFNTSVKKDLPPSTPYLCRWGVGAWECEPDPALTEKAANPYCSRDTKHNSFLVGISSVILHITQLLC